MDDFDDLMTQNLLTTFLQNSTTLNVLSRIQHDINANTFLSEKEFHIISFDAITDANATIIPVLSSSSPFSSSSSIHDRSMANTTTTKTTATFVTSAINSVANQFVVPMLLQAHLWPSSSSTTTPSSISSINLLPKPEPLQATSLAVETQIDQKQKKQINDNNRTNTLLDIILQNRERSQIQMNHSRFWMESSTTTSDYLDYALETNSFVNNIENHNNDSNTAEDFTVSRLFLWDFIIGIVLAMFTLATVIGNGLVIAAIMRERHLRSVSNYLVFSLAVADLMVACLVMPFGAVYVVTGEWRLGAAFCDLWTVADVLCCTASILHLLAIALVSFHPFVVNGCPNVSHQYIRSFVNSFIQSYHTTMYQTIG